MTVNRNMSERCSASDLAQKIKEFRSVVLQTDQKSFAKMLGVTQGLVSHWEQGQRSPSDMALMAIGRLDSAHTDWWFEQAGGDHLAVQQIAKDYRNAYEINDERNRTYKVCRSAGTGPNRFPQDSVLDLISLPRAWFGESQTIVGLYARGETMAPMIEDGSLVLVDIFDNKDLKGLTGKVVAARLDEGVSVRWLKRKGTRYTLVSHHESIKYPPIEVEPGGYAIVGRVVRWIGQIEGKEAK